MAEEIELRDSLTCIVGSSVALQVKYPDKVKIIDSRRKEEVTIMQGDQHNEEGWLIVWIRSLEYLVTGWQYHYDQIQQLKTRGTPGTAVTTGIIETGAGGETQIIYEKLAIATINTIAAHAEWIFTEAIVDAKVITIMSNCILSDCYEIKMVFTFIHLMHATNGTCGMNNIYAYTFIGSD